MSLDSIYYILHVYICFLECSDRLPVRANTQAGVTA